MDGGIHEPLCDAGIWETCALSSHKVQPNYYGWYNMKNKISLGVRRRSRLSAIRANLRYRACIGAVRRPTSLYVILRYRKRGQHGAIIYLKFLKNIVEVNLNGTIG